MEFYDAIVIGAGGTGMYMSLRLRQMGLTYTVIEAGSDLGGTWFWNRYPGCRVDSESYTYCYDFSEDVLQEWNWTEEFAGQPEVLSYYRYVADKYDLRRDMQFGYRVIRAAFDEELSQWLVTLDDDRELCCKYLISATGPLSIPQMPAIKGRDAFKGQSWHTARWPQDPDGTGGLHWDFSGKRVAILGVGSSGVQMVQEAAKTATEIYLFQRHPNWTAPLNNGPISQERMDDIKSRYAELNEYLTTTYSGFIHQSVDKSALEVSKAERDAFFEELYASPGFEIWFGNYRDILENAEANALITEFVAGKIRQRVNDPILAEKLIPKDHGFGTRRLPLETGYYEAFNQDNVHLVDLLDTPIERIVENGIETTERTYEVDQIVYATGFKPIRGALDEIEIMGRDGITLKQKWQEGPITLLGLQSRGFPNLFTLVGPHNGATFCNIPRCGQHNADFVAKLISHMRDEGFGEVEPTTQGELAWTAEVHQAIVGTLFVTANSWYFGANSNVSAPSKPVILAYAGGQQAFKEACRHAEESGYANFEFGEEMVEHESPATAH